MALTAPQRLFSLSLAGGNLRGGLRGGFQQSNPQFSQWALSGLWSPLIGYCHFLAFSNCFCCSSWPGAETQLRSRCYLHGGDHLHLAVNCLATVFSCLSFSVPLAKEFSQLLTVSQSCKMSSLQIIWVARRDNGPLSIPHSSPLNSRVCFQ